MLELAYIKPFDGFSPPQIDRHLKVSIRAAIKLKSATLEDIREVNREIEIKLSGGKNVKMEAEEAPIDPVKKIAEMHSILDMKIRNYLETPSNFINTLPENILKYQSSINSFTHHSKSISSVKPTKEQLYKIFSRLAETKINGDLFKSCSLMKVLKLFSREFEESEDSELSGLADTAICLVNHWERICLLEESIKYSTDSSVDSPLKTTAYKKIYMMLLDKGCSRSKSAELAAIAETSLRSKSSGSASAYKLVLRSLLSQLAESPSNIIENLIRQ